MDSRETQKQNLCGSPDAAARPSTDTNTDTYTKTKTETKSISGSLDTSASRSKKRKAEEQGASSRRSTGAPKKMKASPSGSPPVKRQGRCCRRCYMLSEEEKRARRRLRAAGVPLLTRCEVAALGGTEKYLDKGGQGACVLGRDPRTGQELVLKTFLQEDLKVMVKEATALWALRLVPGMLQLLGASVKTNQIVSLFAGTTLDKYFEETRRPPATALCAFLQAACTLDTMIKAGYAHNDVQNIKNVCVREREGCGCPEVTLIDFGHASPVGAKSWHQVMSDPEGRPGVAPELLLHTGRCSEASDAYALAFIMQKVLRQVEHRPSLAPVQSWIERASSHDPHARPSLAELREVLMTVLPKVRMN